MVLEPEPDIEVVTSLHRSFWHRSSGLNDESVLIDSIDVLQLRNISKQGDLHLSPKYA
jgi:hypothetical protein